MNREVFTKLYEAYESLEMELSDLLEGQSLEGRFSDVFVEVITNKRVGLILESMSEAHNIIIKLQNSINPNNLFRKELADYQEHMKIKENLIRASARNQSTLHLESLLNEEYEQLKKFQQEISSPKTRILYDKQLYTDFIKVLSDNILHNQEEFLRIQKPFNVYREMYGFITDSSSFSK